MSKPKKQSMRCLLDLQNIPVECFSLKTDGRKRLHLCHERRELALRLARYARPDGSGIFVSVQRLAKELDRVSSNWSERKVYMRLDDFRQRGALEDLGFRQSETNPMQHTRERRLIVANLLVSNLQDSTPSNLQDSIAGEESNLQDSHSNLQDSTSNLQDSTQQSAIYPPILQTNAIVERNLNEIERVGARKILEERDSKNSTEDIHESATADPIVAGAAGAEKLTPAEVDELRAGLVRYRAELTTLVQTGQRYTKSGASRSDLQSEIDRRLAMLLANSNQKDGACA